MPLLSFGVHDARSRIFSSPSTGGFATAVEASSLPTPSHNFPPNTLLARRFLPFLQMEAGPSSHSSSSTSSQVTRTLTTYYPLTSETACSQGSQSDDNATRAQQDDLARKLLGRVVSPQQGDKIWRNVVVWEGGAGKGKGRTVVKDEQWQQEAKKAKDQGRAVSSTPAGQSGFAAPLRIRAIRLVFGESQKGLGNHRR